MVEKKKLNRSPTSQMTLSVQWCVETRRTRCPLTNTQTRAGVPLGIYGWNIICSYRQHVG